MAEVLVATANTQTITGSVSRAIVEDLICTLTIQTNQFNDELPIIPTSSHTEGNKVLYQQKLKATLVQHADGKPIEGHVILIVSNRPEDHIVVSGNTDSKGEAIITLETRSPGSLELTTKTPGVTLTKLTLTLKEAWYQSTFLITGYNVCDEADFSGPLVDGAGLAEKHKKDFLYGAGGIPMQGTGKSGDRYIRLQSMSGGWHHNAAGHPDQVNNEAKVTFAYATGAIGAFGSVTENHSIAVDPNVIPKHGKVSIDGVGERYADDRGSAINGYHIDNFLGAGKAVVTTWIHGGINGTQRTVKYLGE